MLNSVIRGTEITLPAFLICTGASLILGVLIAALYQCKSKATHSFAVALAILPACIFLLSGMLLRHWLLVGFAVLFAVGHIYVTKQNHEH